MLVRVSNNLRSPASLSHCRIALLSLSVCEGRVVESSPGREDRYPGVRVVRGVVEGPSRRPRA